MHKDMARDHDDLRVAMRRVLQILDRADDNLMADLTRERIAFSRLFRLHLADEDRLIQAMRNQPLSPQSDAVTREHSRAMVALFLRYSDHIERWTPADVEGDLSGYKAAVVMLQDALIERMEWEERHLHPLLPLTDRKAA